MRHSIVTYTVKPGREEENAALVRAVFEELDQKRPAGLRYAVFQLPETRQFVHIYTDDGSETGVQGLSSFQAFVAEAKDRHEHPAVFAKAKLIGDFRTFADLDRVASAAGPPADETRAADEDAGAQTNARAVL